MKIKIAKIDVAKTQLLEAINLFFQERDPVSIHTLVGASLEILNDHITDEGVVYDHKLLFHYKSFYIYPERRSEWQHHIKKAKNYFKHAKNEVKAGTVDDVFEFETDLNHMFIIEAIRVLRVIEGERCGPEWGFCVFLGWFFVEYPDLIKKDDMEFQSLVATLPKGSLSEWEQVLRMGKRRCETNYK